MKLYHGSEKIIMKPDLALGRKRNDYGQGFYLTKEYDLAGEWACKKNKDEYINVYSIDIKNLKILNLNDDRYSILHWLTILIQNRTFEIDSEVAENIKKFLIENYSISYEKYDLIIGYRADDSYFLFANDFIQNIISLKKLEFVFNLGELVIQYVLKSEKAFKNIVFEKAIKVKKEDYYFKFKGKDENVRNLYKNLKYLNENKFKEIYASDILNGEKI